MKKQVMAWVILVLLVNSLFAVGQTESSSSEDSSLIDCNWWCKIKAVFSGGVVGK